MNKLKKIYSVKYTNSLVKIEELNLIDLEKIKLFLDEFPSEIEKIKNEYPDASDFKITLFETDEEENSMHLCGRIDFYREETDDEFLKRKNETLYEVEILRKKAQSLGYMLVEELIDKPGN